MQVLIYKYIYVYRDGRGILDEIVYNLHRTIAPEFLNILF